jgi:N-acetylneuraminic acid mutarotase
LLQSARYIHTATLLADGSVLAAGGYSPSDGAERTAERYFPAQDVWQPAGSMLAARTNQVAVLLDNGKVLVTGGSDGQGNGLKSAELYDPATNGWSAVGPMGTARIGATATKLPNGRVLVAGGETIGNTSSVVNTAEIFDPVTNSFSPAQSLTTGRAFHSAVALADGNVLVVGGVQGADALAQAELYNWTTGTWTPRAAMAHARESTSATVLADGRGLVAGGDDSDGEEQDTAEVFSPAANAWSATAPMPRASSYHGAARVTNGNVLLAGGYNQSSDPDPNALLYLPASNSWVSGGNMSGARASTTATLLQNGRVLVTGGWGRVNGRGVLWTLSELWTPTTVLRPDGAIVFGDRMPGTPVPATTTVTNTGDSPLLVSNVALRGAFPGLYAITSDGCSGVAVPPGAACTITMRFTPDSVAERNATLVFDANTVVGSYAVALYGKGIAPVAQQPAAPPKIVFSLVYKYKGATKKATTLTQLTAKGLPAGTTLKIACKKKCLRKTKLKRNKKGDINLLKAVPKRLKAGSVITVTVSKPGAVSMIKTLTIRKRKAPRLTTRCQAPGAKAAACSS